MRFDIGASCNGKVKYRLPHKRKRVSTIANEFWSFFINQVKNDMVAIKDLIKQALASLSGDGGAVAGGRGGEVVSACKNSYSGTDPPTMLERLMSFYRNMVNMGKNVLKPVVGTLMFVGGVLVFVACNRDDPEPKPEPPVEPPKRNISMTIPADVAKHQQFHNAVGDSSRNPQVKGITLQQPAGGWPTMDIPYTGNMLDGYGFRGAVGINPEMIRLGGDFTFKRIYVGDSTWIANNGGNVVTIDGVTPYRDPPPPMRTITIQLINRHILPTTNPNSYHADFMNELRDSSDLTDVERIYLLYPEVDGSTRGPPSTTQRVTYLLRLVDINEEKIRGRDSVIWSTMTQADYDALLNMGFIPHYIHGIVPEPNNAPANTIHYDDALNAIKQRQNKKIK